MHILLIEPDNSLARVYEQVLRRAEHTVSRSKNAQAAIMAADTTRPDLVILELELAVHNGVEFLYEFRSYSEWQRIPVIVLSHVAPGIEAINPSIWKQMGVVKYLYKPTTKLHALVAAVDEVLTVEA